MTILEEIFEAKKRRVARRRGDTDLSKLMEAVRKLQASREKHRLRMALSNKTTNIIAEFKRASPSKGIINERVDAAGTAKIYENAGAAAISVLTEEDYFKGSMDDLGAIRAAVNIPVLQKDFIFDEFQIYEAANAGTDAILLIAAMLDDDALSRLYQTAESLGIDALVEVHDRAEMERAETLGAKIIGINNRNLKTFEVSLDISRELIKSAPRGAVMVAESGLKTRDDILGLHRLGFSGFLIGETLMKAGNPGIVLEELTR
jgi:indole-3-glycerol phosphate synthase